MAIYWTPNEEILFNDGDAYFYYKAYYFTKEKCLKFHKTAEKVDIVLPKLKKVYLNGKGNRCDGLGIPIDLDYQIPLGGR